MSKFNAATYVEPMDYDFTLYVKDCKGTVPEPSKGALEKFQAAAAEIFKRSLKNRPNKDVSELTQAELLKIMEKAEAEEGNKLNDELLDATIEVCNGQPSRAEIEQLPGRIQQAFCAWLAQELTSPNYKSGAESTANGAASTTSSGGTSALGPKR